MELTPFPFPKTSLKATGNEVQDLLYEERKGGKIRLAGTISREVMRAQKRGRLFLKPVYKNQKPPSRLPTPGLFFR
jgi:hypothetical protein